VVTLEGRPERLMIQRDGDIPALQLGARNVARVRSLEKAIGVAFLDLPGGVEAIYSLRTDELPPVRGATIEVEIRTEARHDKLATVKLIGPADGEPRLLEAAPDVEAEIRDLARGGKVVEGFGAREAADAAEAEALETIHPLSGGGSMAIEPTRALISIDVDLVGRPGSDTKRAARLANLTAIGAAARLLRLKGLGGLVVFDFVGRGHDGKALLGAARASFGPDNPGVAIGPVGRFGTMEMTVPRRGRALRDILGDGAGGLSDLTLALRLIRRLEAAAASDPGGRLVATCAPSVAQAAKPYAETLAARIGARFVIETNPDWPRDRLDVRSWTTIFARQPSPITASRAPANCRWKPPSAWRINATWRWPIPPGWRPPARPSSADPAQARELTARGNLVAVITNGTAVLGLGNIGPLASKPVMEGKAVLFKKFAGIDVFDLEVAEHDIDRFVDIVAALEPTFGGINLEDIKAPECFVIEKKLRERMTIPVFHDDQHGTAIVCAAAIRNGLVLQDKQLADVKLVTSGAGAAALACVDLLVAMGLPIDNVTLTDIKGVVHQDRGDEMPPNMARFARKTDARTLGDVLVGADVFLGLSAPNVLKARMAAADGGQAADPGAGQSQSGNPARTGQGGPARRHHRHRAFGLCQPGQQCPVLPVRVPRGAGCRRHHHQRGR
jgi:hypothetical protein